MTDRIKGLTVTIESGIRDNDCDHIINAIKQIRGVVSVASHIDDIDNHLAKQQVRHELREKFFEFWQSI